MDYDNFSQFFRTAYYTDEKKEKRIEQVKSCNHEFVVVKKGYYVGGFNSSKNSNYESLVECVHCGLTNKFNVFDEEKFKYEGKFLESFESELFKNAFKDKKYYGYKNEFCEDQLNYLSKDEIKSDHPGLLYKLAKELYPEADNDELFEIMNVLNTLETNLEKLKSSNIADLDDLRARYKQKCMTKVG